VKAPTLLGAVWFLTACSADDPHGSIDSGMPVSSADSGSACFPCDDRWTCGGDVTFIDLTPELDGCILSGLPGRNVLSPDGTITADGAVVGLATGTGVRVQVTRPDGSQWLFCAGGGGCPR
jgi:hypothetical protein